MPLSLPSVASENTAGDTRRQVQKDVGAGRVGICRDVMCNREDARLLLGMSREHHGRRDFKVLTSGGSDGHTLELSRVVFLGWTMGGS
jgi:hypothetical protein